MFAGCIEFESGLERGLGQRLLKLAEAEEGLAEIPFDDRGFWQQESITLVQQRQWNTPESRKEQGVISDPQTGTQILSWSRIDNRDELLSELAVSPAQTEPELILSAWQAWGERVCEHLIGDFSFAIYEPEKNHLFLARDHLGVRPLYVYQDNHCLLFATSLAVLDSLLELDLSRQWLARYLVGCSQDWLLTPYQGVQKVQPAHCLIVDCRNPSVLQQQCYFRFSSESNLKLGSDQAYVDEYRRLLTQAVKARVRSDYSIGSESSGGLDSSAVTAFASRQMQAPAQNLYTYSMQTCADEPECVELVTKAMGLKAPFTLRPGDMSIESWTIARRQQENSLGSPIEHGTSVGHAHFFQHAQSAGVRTMLSGFGGDEFTTTYATTALVEFWQQRRLLTWLGRFRGNFVTSKLRVLKWLYRYLRYGPCTETAQKLIFSARKRLEDSPMSDEFKFDEQITASSYSQSRYDMGCRTLNEFTLSNRWSPLMTARFENSLMMAARYRIEYRWPLLDIRLIRFFLSVPAEQKLGPGGVGRYLHRRAINDLLPEEIVWRDKDMGAPVASSEDADPDIESQFKNIKIDFINNDIKEIVNVNSYNNFLTYCKDNWPLSDLNKAWLLNQLTGLNDWLNARKQRKASKGS